MIKRFILWYHWRCLDIAAYLAYHTYDLNLAQDLDCQAQQARNVLDDFDMFRRMA